MLGKADRTLSHLKRLPVVDKLASSRKSRVRPVVLDGIPLPPASIRLGGHNFSSDRDFLGSAKSEAERLKSEFGAETSTRILEIGCGVGRLPIGLLASGFESSNYTGVDVDLGSILWCKRNISLKGAEFTRLDLANARYNPGGRKIDVRFRLPFDDDSFDVIYLYSVFSHMEADDVQAYLAEFGRIMTPVGGIFLTAFLEDGVEEMSINPEGYGNFPGDWSGELHCVRFSRNYFQTMAEQAGLAIVRLDQGAETDGQSGVLLNRVAPDA